MKFTKLVKAEKSLITDKGLIINQLERILNEVNMLNGLMESIPTRDIVISQGGKELVQDLGKLLQHAHELEEK